MKTRIKWIVAVVTVVVGVAWLVNDRARAESPEAPPEKDRVAELEKEVQTLRDTVTRLEQRLASVEQRNGLKVTELTPETLRMLQQLRTDPQSPSMTKYRRPEGYINGVPYYVIPLKNRPATTQPAVVPPVEGQP